MQSAHTFRQCLELLKAISLCGPPAGITATRPFKSACKPVTSRVEGPVKEAGRRMSVGALFAQMQDATTATVQLYRYVNIEHSFAHWVF